MDLRYKNRQRSKPTFLNINLLGACNADCYFCLGRDLAKEYFHNNQLNVPFENWKTFPHALAEAEHAGIDRIYITGQTTDALAYKHVDKLIPFLSRQPWVRRVGIRTNGILALDKLETVNACDSVSYSIHSLDRATNQKIMGMTALLDWEKILAATECPRIRVAIVVGRYNRHEIEDIIKWAAGQPKLGYIQLRKICTENRWKELEADALIFEEVVAGLASKYEICGQYENAPAYRIHGMPVLIWRTVQTNANSFNYFTDGTFSKEYFIVEGYAKENNLDT